MIRLTNRPKFRRIPPRFCCREAVASLAIDIGKELSMRNRSYARQSVGQGVQILHESKNSTPRPTLWRA